MWAPKKMNHEGHKEHKEKTMRQEGWDVDHEGIAVNPSS
jgi:hypothetical protein